jgi:hypothetical protein
VLATSAGSKSAEVRYRAWGEDRYTPGTAPTDFRYTGQRVETSLGLYFYGARWYDSYLNPIIPSETGYYSPLTVDYHENQFLEQLNYENRKRLFNPQSKLPLVPTNSLAFDRYSYANNNPVRYTDPSGHCIWDLCILEITGVSFGLVELGGIALAVGLATPQGREAATLAIEDALNAADDWANQLALQINVAFAGRYAGDPRAAGEIIAQEKKGSISQEFPSQYLGKTFDQIAKDAAKGIKEAIKTKKLLGDKRFDKHQKRGGK